MSSKNRKIGYYSIEFSDGDNNFFDIDIFNDFFDFISCFSESDRIFNDKRNTKAHELYSVEKVQIQGKIFLR